MKDPISECLSEEANPLDALRRIALGQDDEPPFKSTNSRHGDSIDDDIARVLRTNDAVRDRVEVAIASYFRSSDDSLSAAETRFARVLLKIVEHANLVGCSSAVRTWLNLLMGRPRNSAQEQLALIALEALAASQPRGLSGYAEFWLNLFTEGPEIWKPRAYIGLRLQDPATAIGQIPELIRAAGNRGPGPMLHGLWNQPDARAMLLVKLREDEELAAIFRTHVLPRLQRQGGDDARILADCLSESPGKITHLFPTNDIPPVWTISELAAGI